MAKVPGSSASTSSSSDPSINNTNSGTQNDVIGHVGGDVIEHVGGDVAGHVGGDVIKDNLYCIFFIFINWNANDESLAEWTYQSKVLTTGRLNACHSIYDVARKVARGCAGLPGVLIPGVLIPGVLIAGVLIAVARARIKLSYDGKVAVGASLSATAGNDCSWPSPSGDFAFGFRQLENSDRFLLCIWFAKIPDRTIVWYANGDRPAPKGSIVKLTANNGLVLTSPQGEPLWKSDQTVAGVVAHGVMNDTGNFVLEDDKSESLWETFKNPTDTMLPGQIIERGGKLSSRQSETNYTRGRFQLDFQQDGNLVWSAEKPFYSTKTTTGTVPGSEGKQLVFNDWGNFYILRVNGGEFKFTAKERPASENYLRTTLNFDGVLTQYFLPKSSVGNVSWKALWSEPKS